MRNRNQNQGRNPSRNNRNGRVRRPEPVDSIHDLVGRLDRLASRADATLDGSIGQPLIAILTGAIEFLERVGD